jgi:hypothetical protein
LLVPLGVELLSDLCAIVNPVFHSGIFFTAQNIFLLGVTDEGTPEAPVISTSDSLPTEESEENSISSSADWRSSVGQRHPCQGPRQVEERGTSTP